MIIETKRNLRDVVWVAHREPCEVFVPCSACHGNGGANIPNTEVWVECQRCEGEGELKENKATYIVGHGLITRIDTSAHMPRVVEDPRIEVTYRISFGAYWATEDRVFDTEQEAMEKAEALTQKEAIAKS